MKHEFTYSFVLLLRCKPLLLNPRHVEDVGVRQSFLDAVKLLLKNIKHTTSFSPSVLSRAII